MMAAGNTKPKILTNLTAMMLEVIKQVMKMEATSKNQWEYRLCIDVFCSGVNILSLNSLEKDAYYYTEILHLSIKIIMASKL